MPAAGAGELDIRSDLRLDVDGIEATVVADGRRLTVHAGEPGKLLAQAASAAAQLPGPPVSIRALSRRVGSLLDEAGLVADIRSSHGTLIEFGRGCESRAGRLLLGSEHATFGGAGTLVPALASYVRASAVVRRRGTYTAAGLTLALVVTAAGLRRRAAAIVER